MGGPAYMTNSMEGKMSFSPVNNAAMRSQSQVNKVQLGKFNVTSNPELGSRTPNLMRDIGLTGISKTLNVR